MSDYDMALAQDKIDRPLCDGCGERTWRGDLSDEADGRFCPGCQEVRAEEDTDGEHDPDDTEQVSA